MSNLNWFMLSLLSAFAYSGMTLLFRAATDKGVSPIFGVLIMFSTAVLLFGGYTFFSGEKLMLPAGVLVFLIAAGVLSFIGNALMFKSIAAAPNPGYAEAVGSLKIIIIALTSIVLLGLKPSLIGIVGSIFVLIGVILLSII